jgi:Fe-S cluster assembly protein SufD
MARRGGGTFVSEAQLQEFQAMSATAVAERPDWLDAIRRAAKERFATVGYPSPRDEEWRFTPIGAVIKSTWVESGGTRAVVARNEAEPFLFGHREWTTLAFVDGAYNEALSTVGDLPTGLRVGSLGDIRQDGVGIETHLGRHATIEASAFSALNTASLRDGGYIQVAAGLDVLRPVHLLWITTKSAAGAVAHPRNLVVLENGARASIVESYVTVAEGEVYWNNAVTEIVLGANAWLEHTRIQRESERAYHIGMTHVDQERDSHYRSFSLAMGGALARHNLHVRLNDENIETLMYGLYLTRGEQVVDNHTAIFHDQPNCRSWEVYKGVLDGHSRAVFNGKVFVKPEAQKTDAKQTNRNLLLSETAKVNTKPQLEIFADDVKCTHGATVGRLDDVALFYARSRGVPAEQAQLLLTYAFAAEVTSEVALAPVREELERLVRERLGAG